MIKWFLKWLDRKLTGRAVPKYLSGKKDDKAD